MNTLTLESTHVPVPAWLWGAGAFGVAWNLYGIFQFAAGFTSTGREALAAGMTAEQAAVYFGLPAWISIVFAIGVFGGLIGSVALLMRQRHARPLLAASFVGYLLLLAGDFHHGVFDVMPAQAAIVGTVLLVALGLLMTARTAGRRALLR